MQARTFLSPSTTTGGKPILTSDLDATSLARSAEFSFEAPSAVFLREQLAWGAPSPVSEAMPQTAAPAAGGSGDGEAAGGAEASAVARLAVSLQPSALSTPKDPYLSLQTNLTSATTGINVNGAWGNYSGKGIKVGIVDDGFDYRHADLKSDFSVTLDWDARSRDADSFASSATDRHGTAVAGVIGADANGVGSVGVAYNATLVGFRVGFGADGTVGQMVDALSRQTGVDISNNSWGYTTAFSDNFKSSAFAGAASALANDAAAGRGGLGTVVVFAAGNSRASGDNANYHSFQSSPYVITVGATDAQGKVASFSTPGASLLVSAPGVNIVTTDGLDNAGFVTGDYAQVSGTSFAAPTVSGIVALLLEANGALGWRDVQEILALSARKSDPGVAWVTNGADNWNGGGMHFSNDLGFGLVDATAAVRLAESWGVTSTSSNLVTLTATQSAGAALVDGGSLSKTLAFSTSLSVDKVLVDLNISHARVSDLVVTLTSAEGTTATLISKPAAGTGSGIVFETSASTFWGEDARGTWKLTVTDTAAGVTGTLNAWSLKILGDATPSNDTFVYTNEFASTWTAARGLLTDTDGGTDIVNLSAVSTATSLNLNAGATSTVAGKALTIAAGTTIENAWLGDGNDTVIGNAVANTIHGGRGNDRISGGAGSDSLFGDAGADVFVYGSLGDKGDIIKDFTVGQDDLDLRGVFAEIAYRGANPTADRILTFVANAARGTDVFVDADGAGAAAAQKLLTLEAVVASTITTGDYLWA